MDYVNLVVHIVIKVGVIIVLYANKIIIWLINNVRNAQKDVFFVKIQLIVRNV